MSMIMGKRKSSSVVALAVFLVLSGARSVHAWQSSMHQSLVRLSQIGKVDVKIRGKQSVIVDGADAPDRKKPFKPADHYTAARSRAVRAFDGAVDLHKQGQALEREGKTEEADKQYEKSAFALGNAFHYIEDLAASEKEVDAPGFLPLIGPKGHKELVQRLAEKMVADIARDPAAVETWRHSVAKYKETTFRKYNDLSPMLAYIQSQLGSYAKKARDAFAEAENKGPDTTKRDAALNAVIRLNLLLTAACLDRTIELYNERVKSYYVLLEITFPEVKQELKPKRGDGESKEAWAARKKAFYERLSINDVVFKPLPVEKTPLLFLVAGEALEPYPQDRLTRQPQWAMPFSTSAKDKDGAAVPLSGTVLLTVKGLYDTQEKLLESHPFLNKEKEKEKEAIQAIIFDTKDGRTSGVSEKGAYTAGPLTEGWTPADRQRALETLKAIGRLYDCFIAHAVYGDPSASQIVVFRRFRDKILSRTDAGRRLIGLYYERGPWLALALRQDPQALAEMRVRLDLLATLLGHVDMDAPLVQCLLALPVRWADKLTAGQQGQSDASLPGLIMRNQMQVLE